MKLLQRLNYSASVMKTSAAHLEEGKIAFRICILFELSRSETPNLYTNSWQILLRSHGCCNVTYSCAWWVTQLTLYFMSKEIRILYSTPEIPYVNWHRSILQLLKIIQKKLCSQPVRTDTYFLLSVQTGTELAQKETTGVSNSRVDTCDSFLCS